MMTFRISAYVAQEGKGTREGASGSKQRSPGKLAEKVSGQLSLIKPETHQIRKFALFFCLFQAPNDP